MSTVVTISNARENTLEFDVAIEGMNPNDIKVRFVIITSEMTMAFNGTHEQGDTWSVKIPHLSTLSRTAYDYRVEIVIDNTYYFEPTKGVLNVVGTHELRASTPKNTTLTPASEKEREKEEDKKESVETKSEEKKEDKPKSDDSKVQEGSAKFATSELLRSLAGIKESKKEQVTQSDSVDQQVQQILKESSAPKKKKKVITTVPFKKIPNKSVH